MRRIVCALLLLLCLAGCAPAQPAEVSTAPESEPAASAEQTEPAKTQAVPAETQAEPSVQTEQEDEDMIQIAIGEYVIYAQLAENDAARELAALLKDGPIAMPAYNYGGFEKVCALGTSLTSHDVQTTTQPGDIMLYSDDQIVIFYGSNSWAYTRLAKVAQEDIPQLRDALSGDEDTVTIALAGDTLRG